MLGVPNAIIVVMVNALNVARYACFFSIAYRPFAASVAKFAGERGCVVTVVCVRSRASTRAFLQVNQVFVVVVSRYCFR